VYSIDETTGFLLGVENLEDDSFGVETNLFDNVFNSIFLFLLIIYFLEAISESQT